MANLGDIILYLNKYENGEYTKGGWASKKLFDIGSSWIRRDPEKYSNRINAVKALREQAVLLHSRQCELSSLVPAWSVFLKTVAEDHCVSKSLLRMINDVMSVSGFVDEMANNEAYLRPIVKNMKVLAEDAVVKASDGDRELLESKGMRVALEESTDGDFSSVISSYLLRRRVLRIQLNKIKQQVKLQRKQAAQATVAVHELQSVVVHVADEDSDVDEHRAQLTDDEATLLERPQEQGIPTAGMKRYDSTARLVAERRLSERYTQHEMLTDAGVRHFSKLNYYQRLGLRQDASQQDVASAYHQQMQRINGCDENSDWQHNRSQLRQLLGRAYAVLSNPEARASYQHDLCRQQCFSCCAALLHCDDIPFSGVLAVTMPRLLRQCRNLLGVCFPCVSDKKDNQAEADVLPVLR